MQKPRLEDIRLYPSARNNLLSPISVLHHWWKNAWRVLNIKANSRWFISSESRAGFAGSLWSVVLTAKCKVKWRRLQPSLNICSDSGCVENARVDYTTFGMLGQACLMFNKRVSVRVPLRPASNVGNTRSVCHRHKKLALVQYKIFFYKTFLLGRFVGKSLKHASSLWPDRLLVYKTMKFLHWEVIVEYYLLLMIGH